MPERHPLGRRCADVLPLAILLTLAYGLPRYALDTARARRRARQSA